MVTIQKYVQDKLEDIEAKDLAKQLGVSVSMISAYKKSYNPSLAVALKVYELDKVVLHPFAEISLKHELQWYNEEN